MTIEALIASHNWIVIDDFGPLVFALNRDGKKHRATYTGHGAAHKVNRFTRADAERLAAACNARAAFWRGAVRDEADALRRHHHTGSRQRRLTKSAGFAGPAWLPQADPVGPARRGYDQHGRGRTKGDIP